MGECPFTVLEAGCQGRISQSSKAASKTVVQVFQAVYVQAGQYECMLDIVGDVIE